jgi:polyribonucleotide nucleotidyltransferase
MSQFAKSVKKSIAINGHQLSFEVGELAEQATAAVVCRLGETVVLATVVAGNLNPELGYFPLTVDYQERLYAGGIIKGSRWVKREGRPSDEAILKARLIDRSIRPLFPKDYVREIQVIITILSVDNQNDPDIPALCATSAALAISSIPWQGPIAAVRVGLDQDKQPIINPTYEQLKQSRLDLVVSGSAEAVVMVEAGAHETSETETIKAIKIGQEQNKKIISAIEELVKEVGQPKEAIDQVSLDPKLKKQVIKQAETAIKDLVKRLQSGGSPKDLQAIEAACIEDLPEAPAKDVRLIIQGYFEQLLRQQILTKKLRPDGRPLDQIRPLKLQLGLLPRTHGSAMFKRGATQVVSITTLGSPSLEQLIESMEGQETKRYIHHYSFPPYSVGEVGRLGWPSRREVGHGALAEKALLPVIPEENVFPYTIRVVSETMSSDGSTSMASVCGSTLSLMDAGVPIKKPVAGIAMGLIVELDKNKAIKNFVTLTDIQGLEDFLGDMDFKVAGTETGITAFQMDIKLTGVKYEILAQALDQAKTARLTLLKAMKKVLAAPRPQVSPLAPKIAVLNIPEDKIGEVIGPGGRVIREIIKKTECQIDVNDEGRVVIAGEDRDKVSQALNWIDGLTREIQVGEEFDGQITRIEPYGVFVELLPGRTGMVHVSRLSTQYVEDPNKLFKLGDQLHVRVREIDDLGRISLSALTSEQEQQVRQVHRPPAQAYNRRQPRRPLHRSRR